MSDTLRMDHINSLPQPFLVRFAGDKIWWPVNDFEVQTGLMRIDVCGLLQVKRFSEVMEIRDGDGQSHDPDTFYNEYTLIERLEKATGPDRDLDGDIAAAIGSVPVKFVRETTPGRRWLWLYAVAGSTPDFESWEAPAYTGSLDAALTLVPNECGYRITKRTDDGRFDVVVATGLAEAMVYVETVGAISAAVGTTTAALRAREHVGAQS